MTSGSQNSSGSDRRAVTATTTASSRTSVSDRPAAGSQAAPVKPVEVKPAPDLHSKPHKNPREHEFVSYKHICHYYAPGSHYFGYKVLRIPSRAYRITWYRHVYYCYNGIYYAPYGSYYVVCRPPFETVLEYELAKALDMRRCHFGYYYSQPRVYDAVYRNNKYIDEQYETIARNNEIIARQNELIAQQNALIESNRSYGADGRLLASEAYKSAQTNGLFQSYANAEADYFYQDGVFYLLENGQYKVIVPPAGALVEYIPEDYDVITLKDGTPAYKVDDTVYKVTVSEGIAYFEVMGQLYD